MNCPERSFAPEKLSCPRRSHPPSLIGHCVACSSSWRCWSLACSSRPSWSPSGILLLGGIEPWQQWLDDHAGHFFVWRLRLYAAVAAAWPWVRRRRLARDPQSRQQLCVIEVLGVLGIVLYEASNWLRLY
ncbi:hypothetical protein [Pseudomonas sp. KCJK9111]|uniref:hypothetical protein n=1 Tax=Pseudomonas sp. KCJK9111 TaxID=3344555 RepID=UPI003905FECD